MARLRLVDGTEFEYGNFRDYKYFESLADEIENRIVAQAPLRYSIKQKRKITRILKDRTGDFKEILDYKTMSWRSLT